MANSKVRTSISVQELIKGAQDAINQVKQWEEIGSWDYCVHYDAKAKMLVELIEKLECGSVGGVKCGFPVGRGALQRRLDHLKQVFKD